MTHVSRRWSLYLVGLTSVFLMGLLVWQTFLLSSGKWCSRALGAEALTGEHDHMTNASDVKLDAMTACIGLLSKQVNFMGWSHMIGMGVIALCLGVLVVIVLAGARLELQASKDGFSLNTSKDAGKAAQEVADAAQDEADDILELSQKDEAR